uniref:Putative secreted protein n=1 Tax=Ixodes ricinus TaxID=34613 RepID=A0A6B0UHZ6_IXORI
MLNRTKSLAAILCLLHQSHNVTTMFGNLGTRCQLFRKANHQITWMRQRLRSIRIQCRRFLKGPNSVAMQKWPSRLSPRIRRKSTIRWFPQRQAWVQQLRRNSSKI